MENNFAFLTDLGAGMLAFVSYSLGLIMGPSGRALPLHVQSPGCGSQQNIYLK